MRSSYGIKWGDHFLRQILKSLRSIYQTFLLKQYSKEKSFEKYKDGSDFDGMAVHSSGNIFTSGPGGLLVISPNGKLLAK